LPGNVKVAKSRLVINTPTKPLSESAKKDITMEKNAFELFKKEVPELAIRFNNLIEVQKTLGGLDPKTKQLINIAIQTSIRNPTGVKMHTIMARQAGATRDEVVAAVVMNLHLTGLVTVLECLPAALEALDDPECGKVISKRKPNRRNCAA
jgi:alkylhydroperoxidase/carboxymuconolactone decarboxylase family protein YurZ